MPTIETNKGIWDGSYDWTGQGEEWSDGWNGSETQWFFTIYPRLHMYLPAANVVEIAPGFGRWTAYLLPHCQSYTGFDLAEKCVDACRTRFAANDHAKFEVTDGVSLPGIKDNSVDLLFSFDSLVHVEMETIEAYLNETKRVLSKDGVAFIHHSNAKPWRQIFAATDQALKQVTEPIPPEIEEHLMRSNLCGLSVGADRVYTFAKNIGLCCRTQENINWNNPLPQNCISVFCKKGSKWEQEIKRFKHTEFMREMRYSAQLSRLYAARRIRD